MHTQQSELDALIQALDKAMPDRSWLKCLELLSRTGVADTRQIQLHLGWTRGIFNRRMEKLLVSTLNGEPLVSQIEKQINQPTETNRSPIVFQMGKGGAQLARSMGIAGAHACELKDYLPILHALGMVTLSQVLQKNASVLIDEIVRFSQDRFIRPDIVVVPGTGKRQIYEFEQTASSKLGPRIQESLTHKDAFFQCSESHGYSSDIRMVINEKEGKDFHRTTRVWTEVIRQYTQANGPLHFALYAIPLKKFLQSPGTEDTLPQDWKKLNPSEFVEDPLEEADADLLFPTLSDQPLSAEETVIIIKANGRTLRNSVDETFRFLDYGMLDITRAIYHESYPNNDLYFENVSSFPIDSIHAMHTLLSLHPQLKRSLKIRMAWEKNRANMSQINIQRAMKTVIRTFMKYWRWQPTKATLDAYASADREQGDYVVVVTTKVLPRGLEADAFDIRQSLQWTLQALFDYPEEIGLVTPRRSKEEDFLHS